LIDRVIDHGHAIKASILAILGLAFFCGTALAARDLNND
jgi:hypothetical protein